MSYTRTEKIDEKGGVIARGQFVMPREKQDFFLELSKRCFINGNTVMIRKDLIDRAGLFLVKKPGFPEIWRACEYLMWLRFATMTKIMAIDDILHQTRVHGENSVYYDSGLPKELEKQVLRIVLRETRPAGLYSALDLKKEDDRIYFEAELRRILAGKSLGEEILRRCSSGASRRGAFEKKVRSAMERMSLSDYYAKAAVFLHAKNERAASMRYSKKALRLNPRGCDKKIIYMLASYEKEVKNYGRAERLFRTITSADIIIGSSYRSGALFHLGEISMARGDRPSAKSYFAACLRENPDHLKAREYLSSAG